MKLWNKWFGKREVLSSEKVGSDNIPAHIAIIMDGNGRWAGRKGLPRIAGHRFGMKNVKNIAIAADDLGVKVLTLYAFSTENWKRPKDEVDYLMSLPSEFYALEIEELIRKNVRIRMMGNEELLPEHTLKPITDAVERTKNNTGLLLNLALNYGSRMEIIYAMRHLIKDVQQGQVHPEEITETLFHRYLQSEEIPDPDLLIRTSGELRLSNFMLWQLAYTELWFTDVYWPDFGREHLHKAVMDYQQRKRRYGGL